MIGLLALKNLVLRPWRSAFLLLGYSLGVGVMIVLLSIGEALLGQARDERLVGGGSVTILPEGIDVEVMKTGGIGGMFFSIDHARFVYRQSLASPRLASYVTAVAPQIEDKLLYLRSPRGRDVQVIATGEIPSRSAAVGAIPPIASGRWDDDGGDREWRDPLPDELRHQIDHFHLPPLEARGDPTWSEWHYFNVLSPDRKKWYFISFIVSGAVPSGLWGGQVLVTTHEQGGATRRFAATVPATAVKFSTLRADLAIGQSSVTVLADGRYAVRAHTTEVKGANTLDVELVVSPTRDAYFPGGAFMQGADVSGYAAAGLRADATGSICIDRRCERYDNAQSYHDHNWGVWRGVTWDWGASRAGPFTVLYGRVENADSATATRPLFVYVTDSLGFLTLFRPKGIKYDDGLTIRAGDRTLSVPSHASMVDVRGNDTLRIELRIEDATATDTRRARDELGAALGGRSLPKPYFVQMKGVMRVSGRVAGRPISGEGSGFFETYR